MTNRPASFVEPPSRVPATSTCTAASGRPDAESRTVPVTRPVAGAWARAGGESEGSADINRTAKARDRRSIGPLKGDRGVGREAAGWEAVGLMTIPGLRVTCNSRNPLIRVFVILRE